MDLSELKVQNEGKRLDLRHPVTGEILKYGDDNEKTMYLVIGSSDSEAYRKSQRKVIDRRLKNHQKFRKPNMNAAQLEEEVMISLADVTYDGRVFLSGKEVSITPGTVALDLYREYSWIKEQANDHMEDRGAFLQS